MAKFITYKTYHLYSVAYVSAPLRGRLAYGNNYLTFYPNVKYYLTFMI